jgi:hypothetical protein
MHKHFKTTVTYNATKRHAHAHGTYASSSANNAAALADTKSCIRMFQKHATSYPLPHPCTHRPRTHTAHTCTIGIKDTSTNRHSGPWRVPVSFCELSVCRPIYPILHMSKRWRHLKIDFSAPRRTIGANCTKSPYIREVCNRLRHTVLSFANELQSLLASSCGGHD